MYTLSLFEPINVCQIKIQLRLLKKKSKLFHYLRDLQNLEQFSAIERNIHFSKLFCKFFDWKILQNTKNKRKGEKKMQKKCQLKQFEKFQQIIN